MQRSSEEWGLGNSSPHWFLWFDGGSSGRSGTCRTLVIVTHENIFFRLRKRQQSITVKRHGEMSRTGKQLRGAETMARCPPGRAALRTGYLVVSQQFLFYPHYLCLFLLLFPIPLGPSPGPCFCLKLLMVKNREESRFQLCGK